MTQDQLLFSYLAGVIDSDGFITIKRSTYHVRVHKTATNPVYIERIGLQQVAPEIPALLKETFGGQSSLQRPQTPNSRPLWRWNATNTHAAKACKAMLPFLRIKRRQAELVLELRESKSSHYSQAAYWFVTNHPSWREEELLTTSEVVEILHYRSGAMVGQALRNGTLVGLPYRRGRGEEPRFPRALVELLATRYRDITNRGRSPVRPPELIAWRESLCSEVHELNKVGVNGTPTYHRTGPYKPAG